MRSPRKLCSSEWRRDGALQRALQFRCGGCAYRAGVAGAEAAPAVGSTMPIDGESSRFASCMDWPVGSPSKPRRRSPKDGVLDGAPVAGAGETGAGAAVDGNGPATGAMGVDGLAGGAAGASAAAAGAAVAGAFVVVGAEVVAAGVTGVDTFAAGLTGAGGGLAAGATGADAPAAGAWAFGPASMRVMPGQVPELICLRTSVSERPVVSASRTPWAASAMPAVRRAMAGFMGATG